MDIVVIGAGLIGAAAACALQRAGAQVSVVDAGGASATSASFGWANASYFADTHHFRIRCAGLDALQALCNDVGVPLNRCGCLSWELEGKALDSRLATLQSLGYPVESVSRDDVRRLEPDIATAPRRCLRFRNEATVDPVALTQALLEAALTHGARLYTGVTVRSFVRRADRVRGVETSAGTFRADTTLIAAGTGSASLTAALDAPVPMLDRPAVVIRTAPVSCTISHVLATDFGDVRQLACGALQMPAAAGHQAIGSVAPKIDLAPTAHRALTQLNTLLPGYDLALAEASVAHRPIPGDGLPAVGPLAPGAYVATLHSGITLAALVARLIATELLHGETAESRNWLSPYRPSRFRPR
ncbi:MAG: FAD-binding oxidoreductase [Pseudomonadota bacterium]